MPFASKAWSAMKDAMQGSGSRWTGIGIQAGAGALIGGAYGTFADDSSLFGGAFRGALIGASGAALRQPGKSMLSGRNLASVGVTLGGAAGGIFGDSAISGAMWGGSIGGLAGGGWRSYRNISRNRAAGMSFAEAAKVEGMRRLYQGKASGLHIGRTFNRAYNGIKSTLKRSSA